MATYSHGLSVSFNGQYWTQVISVSFDYATGMVQSRAIGAGSAWTADAGSCTVENYGGILPGLYGTLSTLNITGGGCSVAYNAVLLGSSASTELNGVTKYKTVFKFIS